MKIICFRRRKIYLTPLTTAEHVELF